MKADDNFGDNLVLTTDLGDAKSFVALDMVDAELLISPDSVDHVGDYHLDFMLTYKT